MRKFKILIAALLLFGVQRADAQQDAQYSQYMFNGIYINPAYAGYKEQLNVHSFYRAQWTGITGGPRSMSLAVDAIANDGNVGLALQVASDRLGAQSNLTAYGNYAYRLKLNEDGTSRLAFGVGVGLVQMGIDGSKLNPNDPEMYQPAGVQSKVVPDARAGVYYSNSRFYAGFSADNMIAQAIKVEADGFIAQPKPHYYLTAGMLVPLSEGIQLKPSFLLKDDRAGPTSLDVNAFVLFNDMIWVGGSYRTGVKLYDKSYLDKNLSNQNSAVAAMEVFPIKNLRVGYAYDFSVGALRGYSGGTHEISVGYYFNKKNTRMLTPRYF
ncbi:PorP/SprF family type IX secretion system membrane protein [Pedobacter frigoris]|uniref:Type IX secretion system membrane protein PorP/SprF n=1 Tax=Pedobacter frigoris TaxID=2571272 RepID=A0A4U1CMB7_9SPHI|nr:type IX secretion system membrane protein PorP/SprF [Pedobacter frigoris]TKC08523.1 type IX secretion system membrane protein PorP/SprF [Pedobacter frigoris]